MRKSIVVGLPSYNEEQTIGFAARQVDLGLRTFFQAADCVIVNVDSDSEDRTREIFSQVDTTCEKRCVATGASPRGKGRNLFALFEIAKAVGAEYVATIDADVRTVRPDWPFLLLKPLVEDGFDYTLPLYARNPFEGNVTNHFAYPLIYAVFGLDLRQPIGGEFGISRRLCEYLTAQAIDETVLEYGIDIFMTSHAIGGRFRIAEVLLGEKLHKHAFSSLMYKFLQISQAAITVSKMYYRQPSEVRQLMRSAARIGVKEAENAFPVDEEEISLQLNHWRSVFLRNQVLYYDYLGHLTERVKEILEQRKPSLNSHLWTDVLARFLVASYARNSDQKLITEISNLLAPIFFWRAISFWYQARGLSPTDAEKGIRHQAELLTQKLT